MYPDRFEYFFEEKGDWAICFTGSNFGPVTSFPSGHVPGGWLRALINAHYIFLAGDDDMVMFLICITDWRCRGW